MSFLITRNWTLITRVLYFKPIMHLDTISKRVHESFNSETSIPLQSRVRTCIYIRLLVRETHTILNTIA
ncbi:hypothetical protein HanRHA438_Chr06g0283191 [Helianthus annuus]|nr:hypothetical protein HanRHA438_Chr06g0283191 [Helianthus annuus]